MFDLITIGDAVLDTIILVDPGTVHCDINKKHCQLCFAIGDKVPIEQIIQSVGGNAANVAAGAAMLGLKTAIRTETGDDMSGLFIKKTLQDAGVDTSLFTLLKKKETRYAVVLSYKRERTILSHHIKRSYTLPRLPHTAWVYYTSLGPSFERVQTRLLRQLKKHPQTKLAVNPGTYQTRHSDALAKQVFPRTALLFVNREEAERFVGKKKTMRACLLALHRLGIPEVVVTDGMDGAYASNGKEAWHMPSYPIEPVAKTGAGDAFASGYLSARIKNKDIPTALQWGAANAAGVIQKTGAQEGLLKPAGVKRMVKRFSAISPSPLT